MNRRGRPQGEIVQRIESLLMQQGALPLREVAGSLQLSMSDTHNALKRLKQSQRVVVERVARVPYAKRPVAFYAPARNPLSWHEMTRAALFGGRGMANPP